MSDDDYAVLILKNKDMLNLDMHTFGEIKIVNVRKREKSCVEGKKIWRLIKSPSQTAVKGLNLKIVGRMFITTLLYSSET